MLDKLPKIWYNKYRKSKGVTYYDRIKRTIIN